MHILHSFFSIQSDNNWPDGCAPLKTLKVTTDEKKQTHRAFPLLNWSDGVCECESDLNFVQVGKVDAFRGDNQVFKQHQPDGNAFIREL